MEQERKKQREVERVDRLDGKQRPTVWVLLSVRSVRSVYTIIIERVLSTARNTIECLVSTLREDLLLRSSRGVTCEMGIFLGLNAKKKQTKKHQKNRIDKPTMPCCRALNTQHYHEPAGPGTAASQLTRVLAGSVTPPQNLTASPGPY